MKESKDKPQGGKEKRIQVRSTISLRAIIKRKKIVNCCFRFCAVLKTMYCYFLLSSNLVYYFFVCLMTPDMYLRKLHTKDLIYCLRSYLHEKTTPKQYLTGTYQFNS